jgi:hypothetical protein
MLTNVIVVILRWLNQWSEHANSRREQNIESYWSLVWEFWSSFDEWIFVRFPRFSSYWLVRSGLLTAGRSEKLKRYLHFGHLWKDPLHNVGVIWKSPSSPIREIGISIYLLSTYHFLHKWPPGKVTGIHVICKGTYSSIVHISLRRYQPRWLWQDC